MDAAKRVKKSRPYRAGGEGGGGAAAADKEPKRFKISALIRTRPKGRKGRGRTAPGEKAVAL